MVNLFMKTLMRLIRHVLTSIYAKHEGIEPFVSKLFESCVSTTSKHYKDRHYWCAL